MPPAIEPAWGRRSISWSQGRIVAGAGSRAPAWSALLCSKHFKEMPQTPITLMSAIGGANARAGAPCQYRGEMLRVSRGGQLLSLSSTLEDVVRRHGPNQDALSIHSAEYPRSPGRVLI